MKYRLGQYIKNECCEFCWPFDSLRLIQKYEQIDETKKERQALHQNNPPHGSWSML